MQMTTLRQLKAQYLSDTQADTHSSAVCTAADKWLALILSEDILSVSRIDLYWS